MEETKLKKKFGLLIALVMAITLCLVPGVAQAEDVGLEVVVYDNSLNLENKDANWVVISDATGGTLKYNESGPTFEYELTVHGLVPGTEYSMIYYADMPNRFVEWGGNNPGTLITEFTYDALFKVVTGSVDLGMPMPCYPDANISEYNYGTDQTIPIWTGDNYATAHGAKIWIVPSADYAEPELTAWNPASYLFETDMINYTDTDAVVSITVSPTSVDFGSVVAGTTSAARIVTVTNAGTVPVIVTAEAPAPGVNLFSYLLIDGNAPSAYSMPLYTTDDDDVSLTLPVPLGQPSGARTGTLVFIATPATP